ncbi:hypothetical protein JOB18_025674 [Solea senegalensis]|uniref:Uncharacterized protein n=1 Tax=Solea senegalensis TaxID=28829 RepID=A0AAV6S2T4_SOLSE|nr:hypothetical protein JOB18_025674 [Solea senegalensis]
MFYDAGSLVVGGGGLKGQENLIISSSQRSARMSAWLGSINVIRSASVLFALKLREKKREVSFDGTETIQSSPSRRKCPRRKEGKEGRKEGRVAWPLRKSRT